MQYLISFLEGMITFISPCLLPLLPVYVSYFAGGGERSLGKTMRNAVGFVLGFSLVFMAMGALAGTVGGFLGQHRTAVNLISGVIVIIFGLNFLGVFRFQLFRGGARSLGTKELGFPRCSSARFSRSAGRLASVCSSVPRLRLLRRAGTPGREYECCSPIHWASVFRS